jgi:T-complex protein 1 subunit gamma
MKQYGIWEPFSVKSQTIKTAIESACLLLRVDDVVSGGRKRHAPTAQEHIEQNEAMME